VSAKGAPDIGRFERAWLKTMNLCVRAADAESLKDLARDLSRTVGMSDEEAGDLADALIRRKCLAPLVPREAPLPSQSRPVLSFDPNDLDSITVALEQLADHFMRFFGEP
jgi:hypothetical protein